VRRRQRDSGGHRDRYRGEEETERQSRIYTEVRRRQRDSGGHRDRDKGEEEPERQWRT
jgi:hypothetical protein